MKSPTAAPRPRPDWLRDDEHPGRSALMFIAWLALLILGPVAIAYAVKPELSGDHLLAIGMAAMFLVIIVMFLAVAVVIRDFVPAIFALMFMLGGPVVLFSDGSGYGSVERHPCWTWPDQFWTQTPQACTPDKVPVDPVTEASAYLACARLSVTGDHRRTLRTAVQHRLDGQDPLPVYEVSLKDCGHWRSLAYDVVDEAERARRQEKVTRVRRVRLHEAGP